MTTENEKNTHQLGTLYLFKEGMSTYFDAAAGVAIPVTVMRYEPHTVTQIKDKTKDGYNAVQVAVGLKSPKSSSKALAKHLDMAGVQKGTFALKEIPLEAPVEKLQLGDLVALASFKAGDLVNVIGQSKGKGFAGSVKRYGFAGGPMSHGSKFHRQPGSSGNRTWPGRVMPGKKFPGHMGAKTAHTKNLRIVKVDEENNVVLIRGAVPGGRNTLVSVVRS